MSPWTVLGWFIVAFVGFCLVMIVIGAVMSLKKQYKQAKVLRDLKKQVVAITNPKER